MIIEVLPAAWDDLAESFHFYEGQQPGLGARFREEMIVEIERLRETAGVHRRVFGYHRALARTFPFAVYYSCDAKRLLVRAVLDCRRHPRAHRAKLP